MHWTFAENLKQSMKKLTPEARAAAMGVIFGSDAVRASNVLYENGAEGIRKWTDNVTMLAMRLTPLPANRTT